MGARTGQISNGGRQGLAGPSKNRRRRSYDQLPEFLPGATEFTDDSQLGDPVWIIRELQNHPDILNQLLAATTFDKIRGRKRLPGHWALIKIAMVASGEVDVERFCTRYSSSAIWSSAGFSYRPTVQTAWNRLTELESHADAFVAAAGELIRRAMRHESRIGQNVWVDATGFETHAVLAHCCEDTAACRKSGDRYSNMVRAPTETITAERHAEAAKSEDAAHQIDQTSEELDEPQPQRHNGQGRPYRYLTIKGKSGFKHRFRTLDPDAGARAYDGAGRRKRFWFGGYMQAGIDVFTGAPLATNIFAANKQEHLNYPDLFENLRTTLGRSPETVVMDRGYSIRKIFKLNTTRGVASVVPWRKPHQDTIRASLDSEHTDRHGVPRCKHCGGPGDQTAPGLGSYFGRGEPRIRFRCMLGMLPECKETQSVACKHDWTLLIPMSRQLESYHALANSTKNLERVFRHWRARYTVAGTDVDTRPKRPGLAWQNLRASAALLVEWFRLCLRHGWLGSHRRRNDAEPRFLNAGERLARMNTSREISGLNLPYGPAARRARLAASATGPPGPREDELPF